jgi:hypothetical protein
MQKSRVHSRSVNGIMYRSAQNMYMLRPSCGWGSTANVRMPFITQIYNYIQKCRNFVKSCNPYLNAIQSVLATFMSWF